MPFDNTTIDIEQMTCRRAAELIDTPDKWCKNHPHWGEQRCLVAALADAYSELMQLGLVASDFRWFANVQGRLGTNGFESLAQFNDDDNTTHADVLELLGKV